VETKLKTIGDYLTVIVC